MADTPALVTNKPPSEKKDKKALLKAALEAVNFEYAVIMRGSQVVIMRHWFDSEGNGKLVFLSRRDFLLYQENNKIWVEDDEGNKKPINIGKAWLEWPERQSFEEVYFEPCGEEYKNSYNLWRGFTYKNPRAEAGKFDLLLAHIKDNICQGNQEHYIWVMSWLADLFQKPARKLGTALVLRGRMGIGKGAFAFHIGHLLSVHFMPITQSSQLTGKFNAHMADKVLMFVDEGWWNDERMGQGILRALISEPEVTIEMKGRDAVTFPNFTRFIIAANEAWVVPLGMDDERRFSILDVGDAKQRDRAYFNAIQEQLTNVHTDEKGKKHKIDKILPENGGYEALLHYFLNYKYDESIPANILKTEALCENKIYSMTDELKWWHECLSVEKIGDFKIKNTPDNEISCEKFYEHYQKWCERMRIRPLSMNILPKKLKPAIVNFNRTQKVIDISGERDWYYYLQSLSDIRYHFQKYLGHDINWEEI